MASPAAAAHAQTPPEQRAPTTARGQPQVPAATPGGRFNQTMLGFPTTGAAAAPKQIAPELGGQTLPSADSSQFSAAATLDAQQRAAAQAAAAHGAARPMKGTMLGMGAFSPLAQPTPPSAPAAAAAPGADPGLPTHNKTVLGVARPGIAPLNPGQAKPVPAAPPPEPEPMLPEPPPPPSTATSRIPRGAWILMAIGGVLLIGAVAFALLWKSPKPMTAELVLDDRGREQLLLTCESCPNQSRVRLGAIEGTFAKGRSRLELEKPLAVGDNELTVVIERPGMGRDETIDLNVPVRYRVRGELAGLSEPSPSVAVALEAPAGSKAVVGSKSVVIDPSGKARVEFDVSERLSGPAPKMQQFEHSIEYTLTTPLGEKHAGVVELKMGITPLVVEAPGAHAITDDEKFLLAGGTSPGATLSVAGKEIKVDPKGQFSQMMSIGSVGETNIVVRAQSEKLAPRLVKIHVKRVADLREEAADFRKTATDSYASLAGDIAKHSGLAVALTGKVEQSRRSGHTTVALLEVDKGCKAPPCLARLLYGGTRKLERNEIVTAFGRVTRAVDGPTLGSKVPEIRVDFFLSGKGR